MRPLWGALLLQALLLSGASAEEERKEPGPGKCHAECTKHGCPFGRLGDGCEIDFLAPCRQFPESHPNCGALAAKSCECFRRCRAYFCRQDASNNTVCEGLPSNYQSNRGCYMREGYSLVPEADEQGAKYYVNYTAGAPEANRSTALLWEHMFTVPASQCRDQCNKRGYCIKFKLEQDGEGTCRCYRGYSGAACELESNACFLGCKGRGKCIDHFCHCQPPYFGIGCTRSKVYPPNYSHPSPANFKIYMYELNTQWAYDNDHHIAWTGHDPFMEEFLESPVRTEDPSEASLFYIPAFLYSYSGNMAGGDEHTQLLLDHIRATWPYWDRHGGRDHFLFVPADRGTCPWGSRFSDLIRIVHFGMHSTRTNHNPHFGHQGHPEFGCYNPLRDIVAAGTGAPLSLPWAGWLFFFAGSIRTDDNVYSGRTRLILSELVAQWNDPEFSFSGGYVNNYPAGFREAKFCLAPWGYGFGMRLHQSILGGCVPVVIQEHVFQPYEEVLPYETFSLRLSNEDLPQLRETLRSVTDEQYRELLEGVVRYKEAFSWERHLGGRAFDYTIASLRRRWLNSLSLY
ncbi:hypothetical protein CHLNCDRAFT_133230 [Chlorella variabilis]|uniref:EGF-like domain-containing protein n=1 Tax=Chlorella variabilis TaxID=554065 RepID=E1Z2N2_CHLVA|nr:hypothetical protein CHLNCDRAFT_133230 [Chlorella variabilis]EFN59690.1 hypothetical protein CHLNCDRAFT_133230 [Chlorella variabilis]|eukprot:XP_005851792.1 hypothetical protein CHLNCDRAFT_133230 [Chlorella variabilis]